MLTGPESPLPGDGRSPPNGALTTLMLARDSPESPVLQLSISGTQAVGLLSGEACMYGPGQNRLALPDVLRSTSGDLPGVLSLGRTNNEPTESTGPGSRRDDRARSRVLP